MQILAKLLLLGFTTITLAASIDSGTIFVNTSNRELSDAEYQKISDDYAAKREKERRNVEVTYTKDKLKTGVVYHYTVKNLGWEGIEQIKIGDMYIGEANIDTPYVYDIDICEVSNINNIRKIKSDGLTKFNVTLVDNKQDLSNCLMIDSLNNSEHLIQGQSITTSVYLKKDDPKFANLHWVANFGTSENLEGSIKKAK